MKKIILEMPVVSKCSVDECAYNKNSACHARAITVGDERDPGCDTFFRASMHGQEAQRIAGVGACKIETCKHNEDFECMAESVEVGFYEEKINCLTFDPRG